MSVKSETREPQGTFPRVIPMIDVGTQVIKAANDAVVTRPHSNRGWEVTTLIATVDGTQNLAD